MLKVSIINPTYPYVLYKCIVKIVYYILKMEIKNLTTTTSGMIQNFFILSFRPWFRWFPDEISFLALAEHAAKIFVYI
jgi:hypothetical protein